MEALTDTEGGISFGRSWFVYLVRTDNDALYCGISNDPQRRFHEHCRGRGARFFRSSPARALVYVEACAGKVEALRRERTIKRLSKACKETLAQSMEGLQGLPLWRNDDEE